MLWGCGSCPCWRSRAAYRVTWMCSRPFALFFGCAGWSPSRSACCSLYRWLSSASLKALRYSASLSQSSTESLTAIPTLLFFTRFPWASLWPWVPQATHPPISLISAPPPRRYISCSSPPAENRWSSTTLLSWRGHRGWWFIAGAWAHCRNSCSAFRASSSYLLFRGASWSCSWYSSQSCPREAPISSRFGRTCQGLQTYRRPPSLSLALIGVSAC